MIAALCDQSLIAPFTISKVLVIELYLRLGWRLVCCPH